MGVPRYAAKIDTNQPELVEMARLMGAYVIPIREPVDLAVLYGSQWHLVEVKNPDKEGTKDEFTPAQRKLFAEIAPHGGDIWIWRTVADVRRYLANARPICGAE